MKKNSNIQYHFSIKMRDAKKSSKYAKVYLIHMKNGQFNDIISAITKNIEDYIDKNFKCRKDEIELRIKHGICDMSEPRREPISIENAIHFYPELCPPICSVIIGKVRNDLQDHFNPHPIHYIDLYEPHPDDKKFTDITSRKNYPFFELNDVSIGAINSLIDRYHNMRGWIKIDVKNIQKYSGEMVWIYIDYHKMYWSQSSTWTREDGKEHGCFDCSYCSKYHTKKFDTSYYKRREGYKETLNGKEIIIHQQKWSVYSHHMYEHLRCRKYREIKSSFIDIDCSSILKRQSQSICKDYHLNECKNCHEIIENGKRKCPSCGFRNYDVNFMIMMISVLSIIIFAPISVISLIISIFT